MTIPKELKKNIEDLIKGYNDTVYHNLDVEFRYKIKGEFLYIERKELNGHVSPIARLTYTGSMYKWKFAIFKWTWDNYDPDEFLFPGAEHLDGTIIGALKAGDEAYPYNI